MLFFNYVLKWNFHNDLDPVNISTLEIMYQDHHKTGSSPWCVGGRKNWEEEGKKWKWYLNLIPFHHLNHLVYSNFSHISFIVGCCWFVCCLLLFSPRPRVRFESCLFVCVIGPTMKKLNHPDSRELWEMNEKWAMNEARIECLTKLLRFLNKFNTSLLFPRWSSLCQS